MARTVKADPFWSHSLSQHFSVSVMDGRQKGDNRLQRYPASWQCVEAAVKRNISKCPVITADLGETWEPHASSVLVCGGIIGSGQAATQTPDSQWVRGDSVLPTQTLSSSLLGDTGTDKLKENRTWINLKAWDFVHWRFFSHPVWITERRFQWLQGIISQGTGSV